MENSQTIEVILNQIKDNSVKMVAEHALLSSRKALDIPEYSRIKNIADDIDRIMPKALRLRGKNETP